jgi:vitamin B12 transporter
MIRTALAGIVVVLVLPVAARGQERPRVEADSVPLVHAPPIVVTAQRASRPASRVASSVTAIPRAELERRQLRTVLEALRDVPGVTLVQSGGPGGIASAFLRGAAPEHALVLVDGVEVNDPSSPSNAYDLAHLLTADVERIEVLRGPQAALYGSSAMGGVIQVFTRAPSGPARASVTVEGGSFGTSHVALGVSGSRGRLGYAFTAADRRTDGISAAPAELGNRERDGHRAGELTARLEWRASDALEIGVSARGVDAENDIDRGTPTGDDPDFLSDATEVTGRAWARIASAGGRWRQTVAISAARHDRAIRDDPDPAHPLDRSRATFDGERRGAQWLHEIDLAGGLMAGVEIEEETGASAFSSESEFGPFDVAIGEKSATTAGAFLQHESAWGPLSLSLGGRIDHHSRFGGQATFRAAQILALGDRTRIRATLGTGFKAPTLNQLFDPQFGNADLAAETSLGWDAGAERDLADGRLRLGATVFATRFEDLVGFEFPAGYRNVSAARTRGMEAFASLLPRAGVRVRAGYHLTDTEDRGSGSDDAGRPLLRRPRHQGSLALEVASPGRGDAAVELRVVGERDDKDFAAFPARRVTLHGYALVRLAASYAVSGSLRAFARIENAFDADYEEVFGYGVPGRAAYAGIRATF